MNYDYLIVGAGLFGSVCAYELSKRGKKCKVIDRRDHIAGNIYTEKVNGIEVHQYGAHIFHTSDKEVWDYVGKFAEFNNYINSPVAKYHDELYNLPFNMNTFSKMWGITTPAEAREVIDAQVARAKAERGITEPKNLEEQALSLGGQDIYEKLIKGYTEKQWGRDCTELPAFIIKRLPFRFVYDNNYFNDHYQGIPIGGYTQIVRRMLEGIETELGRDFQKDVSEIPSMDHPGTCVYEMDGDLFSNVIYTGMIDEFFHYEYGPLEYRSLRFETEVLPDCDNYQGNAVVNYTAREVPYTRIIEHKHFEFGKDAVTGEPVHGTVITREYPAAWERGMEPYYPVNNERNAALYAQYRALADEKPNVIFGGRLGMYRYFDMDKVIRAALDTVEGML
jgi:UDP-galactopyranose mutase